MFKTKLVSAFVVVVIAAAGYSVWHKNTPASISASTKSAAASAKVHIAAEAPINYCSGNTGGQDIIVSISKQHLWACEGAKSQYDSAVITGIELYPADLTPVGTYKIYGKQTDQTLAGHDSTGSWSDFVNYWMPFLDNQYGTYGFHDLTQSANGANGRADSDFGAVDINAPYTAAKHGSHGCVELPLATAKWLYNWAQVGTTVSIQS